jgi:MATE family multidrug resistance protein
MGASGMTAQATGAKDDKQVSMILCRSLLIALVAASMMILLSSPIADLVLKFMQADVETAGLAKSYFSICIWGAPAVLGMYSLSGWFIGRQNAKAPMWLAILSNIVNIVASLVLVLGLNMKIEGVAMGTIIAQWISFVVGLLIVKCSNVVSLKSLSLRNIIDKIAMQKFFRINTDIFLRTLCLVVVTLWFTHVGAQQSVEILAANSILMQFFMLFSFFMDGFAYAGEALVGKYYGMGKIAYMKAVVNDLLVIGIVMAIVGSCVYFMCSDIIVNMLTNDYAVVESIHDYVYWAIFIPIFGFMAFVYDGVFIGLTLSRQMLWSMFVSMLVFFVVYLSLFSIWGNNALWFAFALYLVSRGVIQMAIYERLKVQY